VSHRYRIIGAVVTLVSVAVLNRAGTLFQIPEGVALVFPAPGIAAAAGVILGWTGALATFIGYMLLPWGLSTSLPRIVFFAFAASIEAIVPALFRREPRGSSTNRTVRIIFFAVFLNTFISALIGVPGIVHLSNPPMNTHDIAVTFSSWFLGDVMSVCIIGLPLIVIFSPRFFMRAPLIHIFRRWLHRGGLRIVSLFLIVLIALLMEFVYGTWQINIHWMAVFLIVPVLLGATMGGIGGGLVLNGIVGLVYVVQVLRVSPPEAGDSLFLAVFSSYMNLALFTVAAITAGLYSGRSKVLLSDLQEHERLLEESFEDIVMALAAAIDAKDPTTVGHVKRVAEFAVDLGKRFGIQGKQLDLLRYAAILHDIGKIGIPEKILNKRGALTKDEMECIKQHVPMGVEILEGVEMLKPAIPFIQYHQERWDGRTDAKYPGYYGLKGEAIPTEARIITVVDAFDAMTTDRPYRPALSSEDALRELEREAGKQFDPMIVRTLKEIVTSESENAAYKRVTFNSRSYDSDS